ncbi:MAG: hypothetical protein V3U67_09635, partial [Gemmatimonadota bacterium]
GGVAGGVGGGVGGGGGGTGGGGTVANPAFSADIQPIFNQSCTTSNCHGNNPNSGNGFLDLRIGNAHGQLVNVAAIGESGTRAIPGDAANSYLVIKLEGRQSGGASMPLAQPALDSEVIQTIRNWIDQGAADD